jgi:hypothetical protein
MLAGLRTFIPSSKRCPLAEPASMGEHARPILGSVFVEKDGSLGIAEQSRQRRLAIEERKTTQVLPIMLDQVEGVEDRGLCCLTTGQLLEP